MVSASILHAIPLDAGHDRRSVAPASCCQHDVPNPIARMTCLSSSLPKAESPSSGCSELRVSHLSSCKKSGKQWIDLDSGIRYKSGWLAFVGHLLRRELERVAERGNRSSSRSWQQYMYLPRRRRAACAACLPASYGPQSVSARGEARPEAVGRVDRDTTSLAAWRWSGHGDYIKFTSGIIVVWTCAVEHGEHVVSRTEKVLQQRRNATEISH